MHRNAALCAQSGQPRQIVCYFDDQQQLEQEADAADGPLP